jgi:hypothetical protein
MFEHSDVEPGEREDTDLAWVEDYGHVLERRSAELPAFFVIGGLMVVHCLEASWLDSNEREYDRPLGSVESHGWFLRHIQPQLRHKDAAATLILPGRGRPIRVIEAGHPFADYLIEREEYAARISDVIKLYDNASILAENRAHEPVAASFAIGNGALVFVPPPDASTQSAFDLALENALAERPVEREWTLDAERDLVARDDAALAALRSVRDQTRMALNDIRARKATIFADRHVRRAIAYWDGATRPGTPAADAFQELYRMQEMLEHLYGGSERKLADALGIPLGRLKSLKKLANQPEHDFRHATIGDPTQPPSDEIAAALDDARAIVQAFLEERYQRSIDETGT